MNINKNLIARIEESRKENQNPCKNYGTEKRAEAEAEKVSRAIADYFTGPDSRPCNYVVLFNEAWGRWVCCFNQSEVMSRKDCRGGYVFGACEGHYTW